MYDLVLFDLDGTLTDSAPGIIKGFQYALRQFGLPEADADTVRDYIGGPVVEMAVHHGVREEDTPEFIRQFRVYYNETGIFENEPYPGVLDLLTSLRTSGVKMAVATSKPLKAANRVLEHFLISDYFETIVGSGPEGEVTPKDVGIRTVLERIGPNPGTRVVMVGDRAYDMRGAAANDVDAIGVEYGYGTREELIEAGAAHVVRCACEIETIVLGKKF